MDPQPTIIANNVVRHDGTGACYRFEGTAVTVPTTFDYNLYYPGPSAFVGAVAATNYATLAAWQAVAAPNLAGQELNTVVGDPLFAAANDLHITAASPAFNSGLNIPVVAVDIDGQPRPLNGLFDRGADETFGTGLYATFSAAPVSGAAPLVANFTDLSFSSDPGGVTSWAWDFQNDGVTDSFVQNPSFAYVCPGVYSVKLTVTDGAHPPSMLVHSNFITVSVQPFVMSTTGGGAGDLAIFAVPTICYPTTAQGWTLVSFSALNPVGAGPFGGIYPDGTTFSWINLPASPGNPLHFTPAPGALSERPVRRAARGPVGAGRRLDGRQRDPGRTVVQHPADHERRPDHVLIAAHEDSPAPIKAGPLPAHAPIGMRYASPGPSAAQRLERVLLLRSRPHRRVQRNVTSRFARVRSLTLAARGRS